MENRLFSEKIKNKVLVNNFNKNNGAVFCEICGEQIIPRSNPPHFDHIIPYVKGGRSTLSNCQILCASCNLKKSSKNNDLFLFQNIAVSNNSDNLESNSSISKEDFDSEISQLITKNGTIKKKDFCKSSNNLSIHYLHKYYGSLEKLKKHFGLSCSKKWNRESIRTALKIFVKMNKDIKQKDLISKNNLPSLPTILAHYPEFHNFSEIKTKLLQLNKAREKWDKNKAIRAGIKFMKTHNAIHQIDFRILNGLPSYKYIIKTFGSLSAYQKLIDSPCSLQNTLVSKEEIEMRIRRHYKTTNLILGSIQSLCNDIGISESTIYRRYGSIEAFCSANNIYFKNSKKPIWNKNEIDIACYSYIKNNGGVPTVEIIKNNKELPCIEAIEKYYDNWREPFHIAKLLIDKYENALQI